MKGFLFLDVVVGNSSMALELFSSGNNTLLIRGDTLFILRKKNNISVIENQVIRSRVSKTQQPGAEGLIHSLSTSSL